MKCIACGKTAQETNIVTYIDAKNDTSHNICGACQTKISADKESKIEAIDLQIKQYEELSKSLAKILKSVPKSDLNMDGESPIGISPLGAFKGIQSSLAHLKVRRMELELQESTEEQLVRELREALEKEDYETAEKIRAKIKTNGEEA